MSFSDRNNRHDEFWQELAEWLQARPTIRLLALNGSEHTHPKLVEALRRLNSPAAHFVRYAPDGVYLAGSQVVHFDAKAGRTIEKNAYHVYMAHKNAGCKVILFVRYNGRTYWQWIEKIRFQDSWEVAAKFPQGRRFAIDEDGWFLPRQSNRNHVKKDMSGTPFKYLDLGSFHEIPPLSERMSA
jgi:thiamine pyrophosphate-dependent acetolactate synthase large subunit-like protein